MDNILDHWLEQNRLLVVLRHFAVATIILHLSNRTKVAAALGCINVILVATNKDIVVIVCELCHI